MRADFARIREQHAAKKGQGPHHSITQARRHGLTTDWVQYRPPLPKVLGVQSMIDYPLADIVPWIDWTPFFQTWELAGRYPRILDDPLVGSAARNLYKDARAMLDRMVSERWVTARAVFGLFPADRVGDDVCVYADNDRHNMLTRLHFLRQQMVKPDDRFNHCLADYIAPREIGVPDYVGAFAVTAGVGLEHKVAEFEACNDDYASIMVKALADRLAEALAELLHARVRREFWGYATEHDVPIEALIAEGYRGIRPAPGYPACPDHTEKALLFDLLDVTANTGISLTESYAMWPAAAVSGFYFSHPESAYFATGKIDRDQVEDYALRKAWTLAQAERWLAPVLSYSPPRAVEPQLKASAG